MATILTATTAGKLVAKASPQANPNNPETHPIITMKLIRPLLILAAAGGLFASTTFAAEQGNLFPEGSFDQPLDMVATAPNPATQDPFNAQEGVLYIEPGNYKGKGCNVEFVNEGGETFLRFTAPSSFTGILRAYIPLRLPDPAPPTITLSIRWRVQNYELQPDAPNWASAQCDPVFVLENGEKVTINNTLRLKEDTGESFMEMEKTVNVPEGAKILLLQPGLYCVNGQLDIDDLKVFAE